MFELWNSSSQRPTGHNYRIHSDRPSTVVSGIRTRVALQQTHITTKIISPLGSKILYQFILIHYCKSGGWVVVNITLIRHSISTQNRSVFGHCSASELYIKETHLIDWGQKSARQRTEGAWLPNTVGTECCASCKRIDCLTSDTKDFKISKCSRARKPFCRKYNCVIEISSLCVC